MRLFRKQLTRRTTPPLRLSSSSSAATSESRSSDHAFSPIITTYIEPRPRVDIKPMARMAAHELDLRPKSTSQRPEGSPLLPPKRPTLDDILADRSPSPWTFKAFDRYCQHNLCAENLHFVLDAGLYSKVYKEWREEFPEDNEEAMKDPRMEKLNGNWKRLIRDYITRNAPKEVNLPASVRDQLANIPESAIPPDAKVLKESVQKVRELMEESILLSFLNDKLPRSHSDENLNLPVPATERPTAADLRSRSSAAQLPSTSAPSAASIQAAAAGKTGGSIFHKRAVSTNAPPSSIYSLNSGRPKSLFSVKEGSHPAVEIDEPTGSTLGPSSSLITPPGTPGQQRRLSPWSSGGQPKEISTWKKLGSKLGLKKKPSGSLRRDEAVFEEEED